MPDAQSEFRFGDGSGGVPWDFSLEGPQVLGRRRPASRGLVRTSRTSLNAGRQIHRDLVRLTGQKVDSNVLGIVLLTLTRYLVKQDHLHFNIQWLQDMAPYINGVRFLSSGSQTISQ